MPRQVSHAGRRKSAPGHARLILNHRWPQCIRESRRAEPVHPCLASSILRVQPFGNQSTDEGYDNEPLLHPG